MGQIPSDLHKPEGDVKYLDEYLVEYAKYCDRSDGIEPDKFDYQVNYDNLLCSKHETFCTITELLRRKEKRLPITLFEKKFSNNLEDGAVEEIKLPGMKLQYTDDVTIFTKKGWIISDKIKTNSKFSVAGLLLTTDVSIDTQLDVASKEKIIEKCEKEVTFDIDISVKPGTIKTVKVKLVGTQAQKTFMEKGYYHGSILVIATNRDDGIKRNIGPTPLKDICRKFKLDKTHDFKYDAKVDQVILKSTREITAVYHNEKHYLDISEKKCATGALNVGFNDFDTTSVTTDELTPRIDEERPLIPGQYI